MSYKAEKPVIGPVGPKSTSGLNYTNTGEGKSGGKTLTDAPVGEKKAPIGKSPIK